MTVAVVFLIVGFVVGLVVMSWFDDAYYYKRIR